MSGEPEKSKRKFKVIPGGKADPPPEERKPVQGFDLSDTGNAERLANKFGEVVRYVTTWEEHIVYVGGRWKRDLGGVQVGRFAKETIRSMSEEAIAHDVKELNKWKRTSSSKGSRRAMVDLLKHEDDIAVDHEILDRDPWLLNVTNGTLNLKTGKLQPHDPKDLITKQVNIAYDPDAKAPRWEQFKAEVLPDPEVRAFVRRFMGYCLTGNVSERMFIVFLGGGKNGKTAFVNAIEAVMSGYATTSPPALLVAKERDAHPTEIADLYGARLAVASETKKGSTFDEEKVKRLTGGDRLKARRMHENFWEFDPTHKLLLLSNHKPRVKDVTDSFWDRVAIVPFDVRIAKDKVDKELKEKLREERAGILADLVRGCLEWQKKGLRAPKGVLEATQEYRDDEDLIGKFITECCVIDKTREFTPMTAILQANESWAKSQHLFASSSKEINARLKDLKCLPSKMRGERGWLGVRLVSKKR